MNKRKRDEQIETDLHNRRSRRIIDKRQASEEDRREHGEDVESDVPAL